MVRGKRVNRQERRANEKKDRLAKSEPTAPLPTMPVVGAAQRPGIVVRAVARVMLAGWVLKRVSHPTVLALLAEVARQTGRKDIVVQLDKKLQASR
jgi:hypothetical protein